MGTLLEVASEAAVVENQAMEGHSGLTTARRSTTDRIRGAAIRDDRSNTITAMDRDDAGGKVAHLDVAESGGFHHPLQRCLVGMLANRFGEVAITAFVVRDQPADARQHLERVEIVERPQPILVEAR